MATFSFNYFVFGPKLGVEFDGYVYNCLVFELSFFAFYFEPFFTPF